ncbi:MAG: hypothetical protein ABSF26_05295 [Thermoguttaceae bacterium]|jgi:hypothetical protein
MRKSKVQLPSTASPGEGENVVEPSAESPRVKFSTAILTTLAELPNEWKIASKPYTAASLPDEWRIQAKAFTVYAVNRSNWQIIGVKVGPAGAPIRLPSPVGKTCDDSCEECGKAFKYKPVHCVDCTADPYDLYLLAEHNGRFAQSTEPAHIEPNCQDNGVWICADFPD